ncbi:MAG: DNA replication/repair protein RecF [Acidobacteriota bacterium]
MIATVETRAFRNLRDAVVELEARLVVVEGDNAQGKTALLEAAYLAATTRSFRTRDPRDAIAHGAATTTVRALVRGAADSEIELEIRLGRDRGTRAFFVGKSPVKLPEYLGLVPALALAGDSVRAMKGSPAERRRFMDRAAAAARPGHIRDLGDYRRALGHRNRLLRDGAPDRALAPWDEILARTGEAIRSRRRRELASWQHEIGAWPGLFPEGTAARLAYRESAEGPLADALQASRADDRRLRQTTVGPHRDDLAVELEGVDLLRFGSAGQVRAALAALTLAQLRAIRAQRADSEPLLILDDVDTDLDGRRQQALLEAATREAQTLASTTEPGLASSLAPLRLRVAGGAVGRVG